MTALVLIHGAGDSAAVWGRQVDHFSKHRKVLAIDLPGHGARLSESGMDRHEKYAQEVCRMMDQHGIAKAVVVGHSMGGAVAMMMALEHPQRLQGLVLVATGARMKMRPEFLEHARQAAATYGNQIPASSHLIPTEQMIHPDIPAPVVEWIKQRIGKASGQATYADFQANNNFDVMSRLSEVKIPTLVVGGSDDRMAPQKFSDFLASSIAGARLVMLTPSGHYPNVEQEERFNQVIEEFLDTLDAQTGSA